jgi:hypothetical protein
MMDKIKIPSSRHDHHQRPNHANRAEIKGLEADKLMFSFVTLQSFPLFFRR